MFLSLLEVLIGLAILNISLYSLERSVIRKWRQAFSISLIIGILIMICGILTLVFRIPDFLYTILSTVFISGFTFSFYLISRMNGLNA